MHWPSRWILASRSVCTRRSRQGCCTRVMTGRARGTRPPDPPQVGSETVCRRPGRSLALGLLLLVACGPATSGQLAPRPSPTPVPLPSLDPAQVSRGREVFVQHCASCHGGDAQGAPNWQQPDARGDLPAPPHDDTGHTWRHSDAQLTEIIRGGLRDQFNKTPELTMPPFNSDQLSDQEIGDVVAYFKSLWSSEHRQFQDSRTAGRQSRCRHPTPTVDDERRATSPARSSSGFVAATTDVCGRRRGPRARHCGWGMGPFSAVRGG
jgi:mono/diheme cytochrome c family protein